MTTVSNKGGKPMARESFEPPAGFLVGTGEGAEVLLGRHNGDQSEAQERGQAGDKR
jgi:hypothetical protein